MLDFYYLFYRTIYFVKYFDKNNSLCKSFLDAVI
jgi:hypothetical protein